MRGWHTYWRYPGDSGVPPHSISRNRKTSNGSTSCGRRRSGCRRPADRRSDTHAACCFRCGSSPQDAAQPVRLRLKLDYAICEKLCVPAEGRSELALTGGRSRRMGARSLPKVACRNRCALGEGGELAIKSVRASGVRASRACWSMSQDLPASICSRKGRRRNGRCRCRQPIAGAPAGLQRFAFELDGAPTGASYDSAQHHAHRGHAEPRDRGDDPSRLIRRGR